jgi:hypothetical protein
MIEATIAENMNFLFLLQPELLTFLVDLNMRVENIIRLRYNTNHSHIIKQKKKSEK